MARPSHQHRWINTGIAILAALTATLTAIDEHQVVKVEPLRCEPPGRQGTVPTGFSGVASHPNP